MQTKKYIVLTVLFLLPISVYLFFASGKNNFARLPIITKNVQEISKFDAQDTTQLLLQDKITVLGFFGSDVEGKKANAFNLAHKIYKKNYQFDDFQFIIVATEDQKQNVSALKLQLAEIANPMNYHFVYGSNAAIEDLFNSLGTQRSLDSNNATDLVFIIDKDRNLRGRKDDEDHGLMHGFDASNYAEINNKMGDDVKIILAEYRLALKKYKAERKDSFRDNNLK